MATTRVLVVEDRQSFAGLVCDALNAAGYCATPATYRDVQPAARRLLPDLILLIRVERRPQDAQAMQQLQADPATAAIPVLTVLDPREQVRSFTSAAERTQIVTMALAEVVALVASRLRAG